MPAQDGLRLKELNNLVQLPQRHPTKSSKFNSENGKRQFLDGRALRCVLEVALREGKWTAEQEQFKVSVLLRQGLD